MMQNTDYDSQQLINILVEQAEKAASLKNDKVCDACGEELIKYNDSQFCCLNQECIDFWNETTEGV